MARVNFARTYTVEHNIKVHDFGDVVRSDHHILQNQWSAVVSVEMQRAAQRRIPEVPEGRNEAEQVGDTAGYDAQETPG